MSKPAPEASGDSVAMSRILAVTDEALPVRVLGSIDDALSALYGVNCVMVSGRWTRFEFRTPGPQCWCAECEDRDAATVRGLTGDPMRTLSRFMIVCPECGNKRCPRASDHGEACTGSNEPGQVGSRYGVSRAEAMFAEFQEKRAAAGGADPVE